MSYVPNGNGDTFPQVDTYHREIADNDAEIERLLGILPNGLRQERQINRRIAVLDRENASLRLHIQKEENLLLEP